MRVFILAAGSSKRFGGVIKQLLPINGEPLIRRTIRMVREIDKKIPIYVVTWHDELKFPDVIIIDTKSRPKQLQDTILFTEPYWGNQNIFLLGDVVFDGITLKKILSYFDTPIIFAADSCLTKTHSERFALSFPRKNSRILKDLCYKSAKMFAGTEMENHGGLGKLCYATHHIWVIPFISPLTPPTPFWKLTRPLRDYFIFNIYPHTWKPVSPLSLILVDGTHNTDIDTEEEYNKFCSGELCDPDPSFIWVIGSLILFYGMCLI